MGCFIVPASEAVVTTVATKIVKAKLEKQAKETGVSVSELMVSTKSGNFIKKFKWLNTMLAGGSALLAFEHVWHGEVVPFFPFLTAASNKADTAVMLQEMSTVGVSMAVVVTLCWGIMVYVSGKIEAMNASKQTDEGKL